MAAPAIGHEFPRWSYFSGPYSSLLMPRLETADMHGLFRVNNVTGELALCSIVVSIEGHRLSCIPLQESPQRDVKEVPDG